MHVGYSAFFQNLSGEHTDAEVYRHELALADLAEPLGFDSVWAPEHHFTNYIMMPDTTQFLTWIAARTERVTESDVGRAGAPTAVADALSGTSVAW